MNRGWVKIRSWHVLRDDGLATLCGRQANGDIVDTLPAEKSCETCLRIVARQDDPA